MHFFNQQLNVRYCDEVRLCDDGNGGNRRRQMLDAGHGFEDIVEAFVIGDSLLKGFEA